MSKPNHTKKKREIIALIINKFVKDNHSFDCLASFNVMNPYALLLVQEADKEGYSFSKSNYFPLICARDSFTFWAAKEYCKDFI